MGTTISCEKLIEGVLPARVWSALTKAKDLTQWHSELISGDLTSQASIEMRWPSLGLSMPIRVVSAESPNLVLLGEPAPGRSQEVSIQVILKNGGSLVKLKHGGLSHQEEATSTKTGWLLSLGTLSLYLRHYDGKQRSCSGLIAQTKLSKDSLYTSICSPNLWLGETRDDLYRSDRIEIKIGNETSHAFVAERLPPSAISLWFPKHRFLLMLRAIELENLSGQVLCCAQLFQWGTKTEIQGHIEEAVHTLGERSSGQLAQA